MPTYKPVTVIKPGDFRFDEHGALHVMGWTFNLHDRPDPPNGQNACEFYCNDVLVAAYAYLSDYIANQLSINIALPARKIQLPAASDSEEEAVGFDVEREARKIIQGASNATRRSGGAPPPPPSGPPPRIRRW